MPYRQRDESRVCSECCRHTEDLVYRYQRRWCRKCLPKAIAAKRSVGDRDVEYQQALRAHYGL